MNRFKFIMILIPILIFSCDRMDRTADEVTDFFRPPPVDPVTRIIKISSTVGYCAVAGMAASQGCTIPNATIMERNGHTLVYLHPDHEFPFPFINSDGDIIIINLKLDEDLAIMSLFFTESIKMEEGFYLSSMETFPVIYEEDRITAVYAGNDVNVSNDVSLEIDMDPLWIDIEIGRLDVERPQTEEVAIDQNAWIVDVYHKGTPWNLMDDNYILTGGQQKVEVGNYTFHSSTSVMQMAMIETILTTACLQNPSSGFAVLREIEVNTSSDNHLKDLVLGTVFFTFHQECDGLVKIPLATGNFVTSIGKEYDLRLTE
ncbi:MAG: hypothetical protein AMS27_01185 [Bacteroides sp. SM23_62_1]|nr:MAG: hypothetical protein AMS27_01185 [Bacteroides sp. SM23_62_1]